MVSKGTGIQQKNCFLTTWSSSILVGAGSHCGGVSSLHFAATYCWLLHPHFLLACLLAACLLLWLNNCVAAAPAAAAAHAGVVSVCVWERDMCVPHCSRNNATILHNFPAPLLTSPTSLPFPAIQPAHNSAMTSDSSRTTEVTQTWAAAEKRSSSASTSLLSLLCDIAKLRRARARVSCLWESRVWRRSREWLS